MLERIARFKYLQAADLPDGPRYSLHQNSIARSLNSTPVSSLRVPPTNTEHGAPAFLRSNNGPEFIAKEVQRWLAENEIRTIYIDPGSPWQNDFVESSHGRSRDEGLNQEWLWTLTEARVARTSIPVKHASTAQERPTGGLSANNCSTPSGAPYW